MDLSGIFGASGLRLVTQPEAMATCNWCREPLKTTVVDWFSCTENFENEIDTNERRCRLMECHNCRAWCLLRLADQFNGFVEVLYTFGERNRRWQNSTGAALRMVVDGRVRMVPIIWAHENNEPEEAVLVNPNDGIVPLFCVVYRPVDWTIHGWYRADPRHHTHWKERTCRLATPPVPVVNCAVAIACWSCKDGSSLTYLRHTCRHCGLSLRKPFVCPNAGGERCAAVQTYQRGLKCAGCGYEPADVVDHGLIGKRKIRTVERPIAAAERWEFSDLDPEKLTDTVYMGVPNRGRLKGDPKPGELVSKQDAETFQYVKIQPRWTDCELLPGDPEIEMFAGDSEVSPACVKVIHELTEVMRLEAMFLPRDPELLRVLKQKASSWFKKHNTVEFTAAEETLAIARAIACAMNPSFAEMETYEIMRKKEVNARLQKASIAAHRGHLMPARSILKPTTWFRNRRSLYNKALN